VVAITNASPASPAGVVHTITIRAKYEDGTTRDACFQLKVIGDLLSYRSATNATGETETFDVPADGSRTIIPTTSPDTSVSSIVVQSKGTCSGTINVDNTGVVSITNAGSAGIYTITIRATDDKGAIKDVTFKLNVY